MPAPDVGRGVDRATRSWLSGIGLHRPELRAWAWYDWANSAFMTTIVAAVPNRNIAVASPSPSAATLA